MIYKISKRLRKRLLSVMENTMRRKTSTLERYMIFFGRQYPLNFGFKVTVSGKLDKAKIRDTLITLAKRHPIVYAHQEYTTGKQMDMVLDDLPPLLVTRREGEEAWQKALLSCMTREFDMFTGPLFSLDYRYVGAGTELLFVFQHGAADGIAATYFINDFLTLYAGLPVAIPENPTLPMLYEVMDEAVYKEMLTRPEPDWKKEEPPAPTPFDMPPYKAPDFYLRTFEMSEEATARLASDAKAAGETVHSWLGALLMKESASVFGPGDKGTRIIQCPVDFRQYLKEECRPIAGVYNGIVKVPLECDRAVPEIASAIRAGIKASRDGMKDIEEYFHFRDSFDGIPDPESFMMGFPPDVIDYDFSFSNLGRTVVAREYGGHEIRDFYGPIFTSVNGETVIGLNTTAGSLRMSLIFDKAIPKADSYVALGERIQAVLSGFEN